MLLLVRTNPRINGEREQLVGRTLGHREVTAAVAQVPEGSLQVDRQRVVDSGADFPIKNTNTTTAPTPNMLKSSITGICKCLA